MLLHSLKNSIDRAKVRRVRKIVSSIRSKDGLDIPREAFRRARNATYWWGLPLSGLAGAVLLGIIPLHYGPVWGRLLGALGFGVTSYLWYYPFQRRYELEVCRIARQLGYKVCVQCGYELNNIDGMTTCPECGADQTVKSSSNTSNKIFAFQNSLGRFSPWHIDPKLVTTNEQRARIVRRARTLFEQRPTSAAQVRRPMRLLHGLVLLLLIAVIVAFATATVVHWVVSMIGVVFAATIGLWALYYSLRRPFVRQALSEQGDEPCAGCGYQMRGLPGDVIYCPECGTVRPCPVDGAPGYLHADEQTAT